MRGNIAYITYEERQVPPEPDPPEVPLAGVSLELGCHFYPDEWAAIAKQGEIPSGHFERGAAQYEWFCKKLGDEFGAAAVSTCIFLDGYNDKLEGVITPAQAIDLLRASADAADVPLHYIGSEGACATFGSTMLGWVLAPPPPGSTGRERATVADGWVADGLLGTEGRLEQYDQTVPHDISLAAQIFKDTPKRKKRPAIRSWACPYLASIWQLARLGLLPEDQLRPCQGEIPDDAAWGDLPLVVQLDPDAPPFSARFTHTILPNVYTRVVDGERLILDSLALMPPRYRRGLPLDISRFVEYTLTADLSSPAAEHPDSQVPDGVF